MYGSRGDMSAVIAALHRAASTLGAPDDEARQLRCVAAQYSMLMGATSVGAAQQIAEETLAHGMADCDAATQCVAHQVLGIIAMVTGYGEIALEHLAAAVALLDSGRVSAATYLVPDTLYAAGLLEVDAIDDAAVAANAARKRAEQCGARARLPLAYLTVARSHFSVGRWDDALAELEAGLALIEGTNDLNQVVNFDALLAKIAIHRGDLVTAQARLSAGAERLTGGASRFGTDWLFGTQAELLAATGRSDRALAVAEATWAKTAHVRYSYGHRARGIFLVRIAVAAGHDALAREVTADLEEGVRRSPAASAAATALLCRGLVERDPNVALAAVARYRETPLRPDLATCCETTAELLANSARREDAIALLSEAATIHADTEARGDAARVEATLHRLGVRRQRRRPSRQSFGWESLTPMETDVSRLVADGLTNPEIGVRLHISRRTVETHLSHVFTKLGLNGRTQLAVELSKRATGS